MVRIGTGLAIGEGVNRAVGSVPRVGADINRAIATHGEFDGADDYVETSGRVTSGAVSVLSAAFWMKRNNGATNANEAFVGEWESIGDKRMWLINCRTTENAGEMRFLFSGTGTSASTGVHQLDAGIADSDWHHIAVAYDTGSITVWVDGVVAATTLTTGTVPASMNSHAVPLRVGVFSGGGGNTAHLDGGMSDVRVYDKALTNAEVQQLYKPGTGVDPGTANLLAHYKFDEGSGTTVGDDSGNGNDGTATNINTSTFWGP